MVVTFDNVSANEKPEVLNPTIMPNPPLTDDDLIADYDVYDAEGDEITEIEIRWFKNGIEQGQYSDLETITANATGKDELWYYKIRAYDGSNWSEENTSASVEIANSPPYVTEISHNTSPIVINETEVLDFYVLAEDPDGDFLLMNWTLGGEKVEDDEDYLFDTDYDDAGIYPLTLTIQDVGEESYILFYSWEIIVKDVNRIPEITVIQPIDKFVTLKEDTSLEFSIVASDPDAEDILHITWYLDDMVVQSEGSSFTYYPDFTAAGKHEVKVVVSDGKEEVEHTWNLEVEDVTEPFSDPFLSSSDLFSLLFIFAIIFIAIVIVIVVVLVVVLSNDKKNQ
jgi:hypothetical protein